MDISGLQDSFIFTQQSLSTFDKCPLLFKRRYIDKLKWISIHNKYVRRSLEMGSDFHLLARRYFLNIPTGPEESYAEYEELNTWLESLKNNFKIDKSIRYIPEYKLRTVMSGYRLEANFDLLMIKEDSIQIWDWKTQQKNGTSKSGLNAARLESSLQTIVYMFVLKEQLAQILEKAETCSSISMHYWQPYPPKTLSTIVYSTELHEEYRQALKSRIKHIVGFDYADFDKELYAGHCKHCEFNWLCNRKSIDFEGIENEYEG